jgi:hypothetical protein
MSTFRTFSLRIRTFSAPAALVAVALLSFGMVEARCIRLRTSQSRCEEKCSAAPKAGATSPESSVVAEPKPDEPKRAGAAKSASAKAMILRRDGGMGKPWYVVDEKEELPTGQLLLGLPLACLDSGNGAVHLTFLSDLDELSPYPVKENAIVLTDNSKVDLEFTLDRGRVDLINAKQKGEARVRVHVRDEVFDLMLETPGTRIALEMYGRWPRGVRFTKTPGPKDAPTSELQFLVLKGAVGMKHKDVECALKAPPGPALIEWDSVTGMEDTPTRLDKLPPWAGSGTEDTPQVKKKKVALERFRKEIASKPSGEVIDALLSSDDEYDRKLGIMAAAALDDLERLGKALREAKHPDVWENGVLSLRHWIGRGPGQDQILYKRLIENVKMSPVHAETTMQLLHSFSDEELAQPALYQTLIDFLKHDQLAIRGLAHWHLYRLVPAGREIGYSPLASKEDREKAIANWQKLIPEGKMPPKPMKKEKNDEGK